MKGNKPTELEIEIVKHLSNGSTVQEISDTAGIGKKAIDSKVFRLRRYYGLKSVAALCILFFRNKWIS